MDWVIRFLTGGAIVSLFSVLGDVLKPRGFAGLFGAAPSVAVASLTLTIVTEGAQQAAIESRSMIAGAAALLLYTNVCLYLTGCRHLKGPPVTILSLPIWFGAAFAFWALWLK